MQAIVETFGGDLDGGTEAEVFATGFEGASGNEVDAHGFLYQSSIRGNYVSRLATLPGNNNGHLTHHEGNLYVVDRGGPSYL